MVKRMGRQRCVAAIAVLFLAFFGFKDSAQADVRFEIISTYTGPEFVAGVRVTDEISFVQNQIEDLLVGWRGPQSVESRYDGLNLDIQVVAIDGPGAVLAAAGPTATLDYGSSNGFQGALSDAGNVQIDEDDIAAMILRGSFRDTLMHEMFHAIGSGTLWEQHGLIDSTGFGYLGAHGLDFYQRESGNTFAALVPLETGGGPGTAGGHWEDDDPYFVDVLNGRQEINTGTDFGFDKFISNVTLASFRDIGYLVPSLGGDEFQFGGGGLQFPSGGSTKPEGENGANGTGNGKDPAGGGGDGGGDGPLDGPLDGEFFVDSGTYDGPIPVYTDGTSGGAGPAAVPEPTGLALMSLLVGLGAVGIRRRRNS